MIDAPMPGCSSGECTIPWHKRSDASADYADSPEEALYVLVNGQIALEDSRETRVLAGRIHRAS